jgi:hypothetical protein
VPGGSFPTSEAAHTPRSVLPPATGDATLATQNISLAQAVMAAATKAGQIGTKRLAN